MPRKKTHQEFINEVKQKRPEVIVLGKYIDARTKIPCYCTISKIIWSPTTDNLLRGKKCHVCALKSRTDKRRKSHEQFVQEIAIKHPNLIINEQYKGAWEKISCTCTVCNTTKLYYPADLLYAGGCWVCGNKKIGEKLSMKLDTFLNKLSEVNINITYQGNFINASEHVDVKCNICGHEWSPVAKSLLQGCGCPICNQSHGEKEIDKCLHANSIEHIHQKEFDGLVGLKGGNLSYDFYLPTYNLLIEYQGEYHDGTAIIQTEEEFLKQQEHDGRKKEYAIIHSIDLLEIWYYDFNNIIQILDTKLNSTK